MDNKIFMSRYEPGKDESKFQIVFDEDGALNMETNAEETDIYYDEIGSGLLVNKIRQTRQDLFESLSMYYRVVILGEDVSKLLDEE